MHEAIVHQTQINTRKDTRWNPAQFLEVSTTNGQPQSYIRLQPFEESPPTSSHSAEKWILIQIGSHNDTLIKLSGPTLRSQQKWLSYSVVCCQQPGDHFHGFQSFSMNLSGSWYFSTVGTPKPQSIWGVLFFNGKYFVHFLEVGYVIWMLLWVVFSYSGCPWVCSINTAAPDNTPDFTSCLLLLLFSLF